jgi:riboflavin biosynthesis pyrimidine reductase
VWIRIRRCATTTSGPRSPKSGARSRRSSSATRWTAFKALLRAPRGRWPKVAAALDATDKDVAIGGAGLAAAGIELGLIDELRMFGNPIVVGCGTPFLPPVTERIPLELIETRTFGSRVIYERYWRVRDELA